jgi:ankyrin repeat protein
MFSPPIEEQKELGWMGEMSRVEAEGKLRGTPLGTYLSRWNRNTGSIIFNYQSVAFSVYKRGEKWVYFLESEQVCDSLLDVVWKMKEKGIFKHPLVVEPSIDEKLEDNMEQELCRACYRGDIPKIQKLIQMGANVNCKTAEQRMGDRTALYHSVQSKNWEVVKLLLDHGAGDNNRIISDFLDINGYGFENETAVWIACYYGYSDVLKLLIERGADLGATNSYGVTPLHIAVIGGRIECVQLLLEAGVPYDSSVFQRRTPLSKLLNWNYSLN